MSVNITIKNAVKRYGDNTVISDISLDVKDKELFTLLGPSGCGKTTLLRMIAGFATIEGGEFFFNQKKINDMEVSHRNIGMVFQNYAIFPHYSVRQNVEFGLRNRKYGKKYIKNEADKFLKLMHIYEYRDKKPEQLSGGQQQRIALARALVIEPDILLLDEPLSNLDAKLRLEMRKEIKRIHSEANITSVYVTHDQKEALSLADRAAIMKDGKIMQIGTPREIYNRPASCFVADFIGETNFLRGKVKARDGGNFIIDTAIGEVRSAIASKDFSIGDAVRCSIRPESVSIEDSQPRDRFNVFQARITSTTYLGDVEEYWLNANHSVEMKAVLHNPGQEERQPGDEVFISFLPENTVSLHDMD